MLDQFFLAFTQIQSVHLLLKHVPSDLALIFISLALVVLTFNVLLGNFDLLFQRFSDLHLLLLRLLSLATIIICIGCVVALSLLIGSRLRIV